MDSNLFTDVHKFDGMLKISLERNFHRDEKLRLIDNLIIEFNDRNKISIEMLKIIREDLYHNRKDNYDESNKIDATDILANILIKKKNERSDLYNLLEEQLIDMYILGPCPQGRVGRLYQLYLIFKNI